MSSKEGRTVPLSIGVRRLRSGEWGQYRDVRLRALRSDPLAFGSTFAREQRFEEREWRERAARGASGDSGAKFVGVTGAGDFVGLIAVAESRGEWHVFEMWLEPAWRGRGIGARLLDDALAWFRTTAPRRDLILEVNPRQSAAERLYRSRGFRPTGQSGPLGHTEGETVITMVLAADLPRT